MMRRITFVILLLFCLTPSARARFKEDEQKYLDDQFKAVLDQMQAMGNQIAGLNAQLGELKQSQAALELAKTNLDNTVIKSPIKGVIIDRRVNVGQNVGPSANAPGLFLIAKNLEKIQVWASVNEADIARIHKGTEARFTVDAFPKDVFRGKVAQVRLNAAMTQNVVTYTVVVTVDNPGGTCSP